MTTTPAFLTEFDDDVTASESIPFCQIQNPKNLSLSEIRQYNVPWGIFVPTDQAELVELADLDYFTPTSLVFDQDTPQERSIDGFLTHHLRFALIHRSAGIEVQEKMSNGWKYVGKAYRKGKLTKYGELASKDRELFRLRTRYLLLFLDENNEPLHRVLISVVLCVTVHCSRQGIRLSTLCVIGIILGLYWLLHRIWLIYLFCMPCRHISIRCSSSPELQCQQNDGLKRSGYVD